MGQPLPVMIIGRPAEYGPEYAAKKMFDQSPGSQWVAPQGAPMPQSFVLQLHGPAWLEGVVVDPRAPGYDNCGPREVLVEVAAPENAAGWVPVGLGAVQMGAITRCR